MRKVFLTLSCACMLTGLLVLPVWAHSGSEDDHSHSSSSRASSAIISSAAGSRSVGSEISHSSDDSEEAESSRSHGNSSSARSSDDGSDTTVSRRRNSKLSQTTGVTTTAKGKAQYIESQGERRLTITVQVPLGSATPPVADATAAEALQLAVQLSRAGASFATCQLEFKKVDADSNLARYEVNVRKKSRKQLQERFGSCVLTSTGQPGFPLIKRGDVLTIEGEENGTFLDGQF